MGPDGPPPGDMGPGDMGPGGPPPGDMADMQSHMDDAGAHHGPDGPPIDPAAGMDPGDMPADMPPPPDDPNDGGEVV